MTKVALIGGGKMGLPLACQIARRGAEVVVCDIDDGAVDRINRGVCAFDEPDLPGLLAAMVAARRLRATSATTPAVQDSDVVVVIVPVLLTAELRPDLTVIESVTRDIAAGLRPGTMVSYETTLPVGTTRRLVDTLESSGLRAGADFDVVYSPERVKSRLVLQRLTENPKVVGGLTPAAAERAASFYGDHLGAPVTNVGSLEAAELVKLAGMIYRDVNIALSNELAGYAEACGVDFARVLRAANTDGEANLLTPGIGVGGHCTPVYPRFLLDDARRRGVPTELTSVARCINDGQPGTVLDRVEREWGSLSGRGALILGLGFRPQVKEHVCSPAFTLRAELALRGALPKLHDPLYDARELRAFGFEPARLQDCDGERAPEVLILNTAHAEYVDLDFSDLARRGVRLAVDGRGLWSAQQVRAAGVAYLGVGCPGQ